jgi:hypothetical protein
MPSWETNCIEDWETKVDGIVDETINENMSVISEFRLGSNVFEKLSQNPISLANCLKLQFVYLWWCKNYEPYRAKFENLIDEKLIQSNVSASEGFCHQDSFKRKGMLLLLNAGIFYEFVNQTSFLRQSKTTLPLEK